MTKNEHVTAAIDISPKEFVRLWNMILYNVKKIASSDAKALPCVVMSLEDSDSMSGKMAFVIERLNCDNSVWSSVGAWYELSIDVSEGIINVSLTNRKEVLV